MTKISERQNHALPLADLPLETRYRIAFAVAAPAPPPRWLDLGLAKIESRAWYEWHWQRGQNPARERLDPELRQKVIDRDGHICQLCFLEVDPSDVHIDHIKPRSLGGPDRLENLQVTHSRCNIQKGARWQESAP